MSSFIVDFYDAASAKYIGPGWNSSHLGGEMPNVGDIIFAPESKKDFGLPRDPDKYRAYDVTRRYFFPDIEGGPCLVKVFVTVRDVSDVERTLL